MIDETLDSMLMYTIGTNSRISKILEKEIERQENTVELIASENYPSPAVRAAMATPFCMKYTEGYPNLERETGKRGRYYGGCKYYDELEEYCCSKWKEVFNTDYHVNVQPHSGSQANAAAYQSVLKPGDKILAMSLDAGGHLTHSSSVSFVGKIYNVISYGLTKNGYLNYTELQDKIYEYHPKLIVVGASAYSRFIDFNKIKKIIDECERDIYNEEEVIYRPYLMVDMAHIAGLIAAGEHPSPFGIADIITTTTHKTLRGPRGGLVFCKPELANKIDSAVFPGTQGGPLQHIIAAKAIAAEEACTEEYHEYIRQVVKNCKAMCNKFKDLGYHIISNGTDNHMFLLDLSSTNVTGKALQEECDRRLITLNKNAIVNDPLPPSLTSGVRIGTAAMTTLGWKEQDFIEVAEEIDAIIKDLDDTIQ